MDPALPPATQSAPRWFDVLHFFQRFPAQVCIADQNVFTAALASSQIPVLAQATAGLFGAEFFTQARSITCLGVRVESDSLRGALSFTRYYADAVVDGFSFALSRPLPQVAALVVVCDHAEPMGQWVAFSPESWLQLTTTKPDPEAPPSERTKTLLGAASPLLDVVSKVFPNHDSAVSRQLAQSLKMYRHGATASSFAVEFICKLSALEGLICAQQERKAELLRTRLPTLFRQDPLVTAERIKKLWKARNAAIHESAGFYSSHAGGSLPVHVHIHEIDYLFRGTVAFVIAHLKTHATLPALWAQSGAYVLPAWALDRKGEGISLLPHEIVMPFAVGAPWAKPFFEKQWAQARQQQEDPTEPTGPDSNAAN